MTTMDFSTPQEPESPALEDVILAGQVIDLLDELAHTVKHISNDALRLDTLNEVLDGATRRSLEGERQKLDPWGSWMHSSLLDIVKPGEHETAETRKHVETWQEANVMYSAADSDPNGSVYQHVVALDIDLPMRVVPSTHKGRGHLWINRAMPWDDVVKLLDVLVEVGVVSESYRQHSLQRGYTCLRPAFVDKKPWSFSSDTSDEVDDDHEHVTDGSECWCHPEVVSFIDGE